MSLHNEIERLKLAVEEAGDDFAKADALLNLLQNLDSDPAGQLYYGRELIALADKSELQLHRAWANLFLSAEHYQLKQLDGAQELVDGSFGFFEAQNDLAGLAEAYLRYGRIEMHKGEYAAALQYYFKAVEIREEWGGIKLAHAYFFVAHAYSETFNTDLSITYFEKALRLFEKSGEKIMLARCYNNIGANYYDFDKQKSLQFHLESMRVSEEVGNPKLLSYAYYWVGTLHIDNGQYERAEEYLQKTKKICEEIDNKHILAYSHISLGRLRTHDKNYTAASLHFEQAWKIATDVGDKTWERAVYRDWYHLKKAQGDFEAALDLYERYIKLDREVSHIELTEKVAAVKFKSDIEKKEKDLEIQHLRNMELKQEKEKEEQMRLAAEESERFKEQFLANMSHEIRTPMNAVLGMTNLLLDTPLNEKQKGYLLAVKRSSENLLIILNDILDLSKLEAGRMELERLPFRLHEQVAYAMEMMSLKAEEKGLLFNVTIDNDVPEVVIGDAPRLNQVLLNILSNAIKFTETGFVKLQVAKHAGERVKFTVTDSGIGMSAAQQSKIFESFTQAESNTNRKYGGTGLGLAICKTLVELQGGTIDVKSEPGKGSGFTFVLPYRPGRESDIITHESASASDYSVLSKLKILVVEDYEFNQIVIKDTLEHLLPGIKVDIADNGKLALEKLKQNSYDLVLMDVQMPEMDGYEATRLIRQDLKLNIPIVALTASVIRSDLDKCLDAGMNGYIPKPFEREVLLNELMKQCTVSL